MLLDWFLAALQGRSENYYYSGISVERDTITHDTITTEPKQNSTLLHYPN